MFIDIFHGITYFVVMSVRTVVGEICLTLNRMVSEMGDTKFSGIDLACRVMFELQ